MAKEKQITQGKDAQVESSKVQLAEKGATEADELRLDVGNCKEVEINEVSRIGGDEGNNGREISDIEAEEEGQKNRLSQKGS